MKRLLLLAVGLAAGATTFTGCEKPEDDSGAGKPAAVENLTATPGNAQVVLDWETPADDGGSPITGYELTHDNWANKVTKTADELTHTYTGLTNSTEYTFRVRAVNADGSGAESTATATPTAPIGPEGPLGTDYTLPENLKIVFTYPQGDYGGGDGTHTAIKIGNRYWRQAGTMQYYVTWSSGQTRIYSNDGSGWKSLGQIPDTEVTLRKDWLPVYIYPDVVSHRERASGLYDHITGSSTIAGRPTQIRTNASGEISYYIDIEHTVILKETNVLLGGTVVEVTLWDETVKNFGNISLPE